MKKFALALSGFALLAITPVLADNTDTKTVTVSGTIVAPLEIGTVTNLTMPHLVRPSAGESDTGVTVACGAAGANIVTYSGQGNPFANGTAAATKVSASSANGGIALVNKTGTCATVAVTGETGYFFQVSTGSIVAPTTGGVTVSSPVCTNNGAAIVTNVVLTGGSATLLCGATVSATAAAVSYADGKFDVTVTYD